ncbi:MAG TPA: hypothetical protein VNM70_04520 [Burkholderiales bacterium]|jgi:hypothetical protein|nr:hypothetical protein [Burkholderiales bacterium]HWP87121.1 hypothetical protein [Burkholderiales bacterium]
MRIRLLAVGAALIAGCAGQQTGPTQPAETPPTPKPPTAAEPGINLSGYSPAFRAGYADGCNSVDAGARKRDEARFKAETDYAQGWRDGNDICKRKK